jgi:SAM-dependent methyltransferase
MSELDRTFAGSIPETYDAYMGPMLFEPFAREVAGRFKGFAGAILETAAGTGRLTRALAEVAPAARITATDLNPPMLQRAAALVDAPNVTWQAADAQALPFADDAFDAVVCQFGVMFLPDRVGGYFEARRVLKTGGLFVFSVWDRLEANDLSHVAQEAIAALYPDNPPNFFERVPFAYNDPDRIRADLAAAGFARIIIDTVRLPTPAASAADAARGLCLGTPLRNELEARGPQALEGALQAATEALTSRFGDGAIEGTGQAVVVSATTP